MNDEDTVLAISVPQERPVARDHPLHPLAQSMELTKRFAASQARHDLVPGMLCREKPGLGILLGRPVLLFCRPLLHDNFEDRAIIAAKAHQPVLPRLDCIVWRLSDDAVCVLMFPHCVAFLEPYDPETSAP